MSFLNKLIGELVDVIEYPDAPRESLVYRFPRYENQIKYGARLIVREGQGAVFVNEGALADVFVPGTYALETRNLPVLSTLRGWKYGFTSPFRPRSIFSRCGRCSTSNGASNRPLPWNCPATA